MNRLRERSEMAPGQDVRVRARAVVRRGGLLPQAGRPEHPKRTQGQP